MNKKYVIFKDDDAGKDLESLKRWVDVVIENNAKGAIGLIGKYLRDPELVRYLNSLDKSRIEIFCHGFYHNHLPYLVNGVFKDKEILHTEFDKTVKKHDKSLKKYCDFESKYLNSKAIAFGPQGNIWNKNVIEALLKNNYKLMFSWENVGGGILTIPLSSNLRQNSLDEFIEGYEGNKNDVIYTLQFHHAKLTDKNFEVMAGAIDYLKNKEGRIFVTPSELLDISKENDKIFKLMSCK